MIKKHIAKLLESEMDRKSFLKTTAVTAVALTGVTAAFNTLITSNLPSVKTPNLVAGMQLSAYGDAQYGKPELN